jgi:hypothetical protein
MATNKGYATSAQLAQIIGIKSNVPTWEVGKTPENESVGQGDSSTTEFYLDQKNILDGSYTVYHGTSQTSLSGALTDVTHYAIESDTGKITLTASGVTTVANKNIYAKYSYTKNGMENSYLVDVLNRAEAKVDSDTNTTFTDGTANNPTYPLETEIQSSPGYFREQIIVEEKPLIDVVTTISGVLTISGTTVNLASNTGLIFPSSGSVIIDSEVVSYTGTLSSALTGVTRGVYGTVSGAHADGAAVHSTILFLSDTEEGTDRTYTVQPWNTAMHATETGLIYTYSDSIYTESQYPDKLIQPDVADRVKIMYYHGYDTIPADINRLTLIYGKEMLIKDSVGASLIAGRDEFNPGMVNVDKEEIERIINSYIVLPMGNT